MLATAHTQSNVEIITLAATVGIESYFGPHSIWEDHHELGFTGRLPGNPRAYMRAPLSFAYFFSLVPCVPHGRLLARSAVQYLVQCG